LANFGGLRIPTKLDTDSGRSRSPIPSGSRSPIPLLAIRPERSEARASVFLGVMTEGAGEVKRADRRRIGDIEATRHFLPTARLEGGRAAVSDMGPLSVVAWPRSDVTGVGTSPISARSRTPASPSADYPSCYLQGFLQMTGRRDSPATLHPGSAGKSGSRAPPWKLRPFGPVVGPPDRQIRRRRARRVGRTKGPAGVPQQPRQRKGA
jgi:hypothetical protein